MFVSRIMTKNPISVDPCDSLEKVLDILTKNRISGCPVVDGKRLLGVITESDIIRIIDVHTKIHKPESGLFPLILAVIKDEKYDALKSALKDVLSLKVKTFMSKKAVTIDVNDDVYKAARLLNRHDIDRLPVTENKKLVGIITRWDLIRALDKLEK
ncbi:MAG: CBS domain-containing protein [Candidatus Aenigmatarchaeota archaeon]